MLLYGVRTGQRPSPVSGFLFGTRPSQNQYFIVTAPNQAGKKTTIGEIAK